jgi:hypothetical protein
MISPTRAHAIAAWMMKRRAVRTAREAQIAGDWESAPRLTRLPPSIPTIFAATSQGATGRR